MNPEQLKSEKQILWEQKRAEVDKITDSRAKEIDEKIKEPVVAFLMHEFTTSGSCEGYVVAEGEDEHKVPHPYPWIEVYAPEPEGWEESEEKRRERTIKNLKQQQRMTGLLEEFYQRRETPFDARLTFRGVGNFGGFCVQSFGAQMMTLLTHEEQKQKLELYRKEMDDFTKFLRDTYFSKE